MIKKILAAALALALLCSLAACGGTGTSGAAAGKKLSVVTTIFPEYDWVRQIIGDADGVELTLLLDKGVDLHSYQPSVDDLVKISTCDLFVYVGGESDEWVDDVLEDASNPAMRAVNLLEVLGDAVKEEELVEGMEAEHDHDHEDENHEDEDHEDEDHEDEEHEHEEEEGPEYDEHVWLSLKNAAVLCRALAGELGALDGANKAAYEANAAAYCEKLEALDGQYAAAVAAGKQKTLLFADRFPFRYLVDDYGLGYYAAFAGCSAESEASFETVLFLANKVDELGLSCVLQLESADGSIAETVCDTAKSENIRVLTMDSLQSSTLEDARNGVEYLSVMEKNLTVLKEALG